MFALFPDLYKVTMLGGELLNVLTQHMCIPFRRDVLKHYKKCYSARLPESIDNFVSEYIHNNVNIIIHCTMATLQGIDYLNLSRSISTPQT